MENIDNKLRDYRTLWELLKQLENLGETFIIGGALREFRENNLEQLPRDFDLVVDTDDYHLNKVLFRHRPHRNRFGGYKINDRGIIIDIWCLKDTWAYKEKKIVCRTSDYGEKLQDTVFLNIDAIVYNFTKKVWYDANYIHAMNTKELDVVLEANPQLPLNIMRSILLKNRYSMQMSSKLKSIICNYVKSEKDSERMLMSIQMAHYNYILIDQIFLKKELELICGCDKINDDLY